MVTQIDWNHAVGSYCAALTSHSCRQCKSNVKGRCITKNYQYLDNNEKFRITGKIHFCSKNCISLFERSLFKIVRVYQNKCNEHGSMTSLLNHCNSLSSLSFDSFYNSTALLQLIEVIAEMRLPNIGN